ncbi:MAG: group III truncated hemoglobin [Bacteroidota bacterium]
MRDIETRADIELLMQTFYSRALTDETIGYFFTEVVPLNMEVHMPLIVDFWETVLLGKAAYRGNVMQVHQHIHSLSAFKEEHFAKWVFLFHQTVNELYSGDCAELAKQRAESIATLMRIKLLHSGIDRAH